jgi:flagellar FliL protein
MANSADGAASLEAGSAGAKRRLLLLVAAGLVLLAGGGAGAAYALGLFGAAPHAEETADEAAGGHDGASHADARDPAAAPQVIFVDLPDIVVNLQAPGPRMRFLRVRLALEVGDEAAAQHAETLIPRLLDSYQHYLRALTPDDVAGPGGMQRLKEDLLARSNIAVTPTKVADVLLKEMLVQ